MTAIMILATAFFLPLFPFSIAFNQLFARITDVRLRVGLLLLWPQIGILLLAAIDDPLPAWMPAWAMATAAFYAFRSLALRELGQWTSFLATSVWAVLWIKATVVVEPAHAAGYALGFSLPLVLLVLLGSVLERRFGAAYTGLTDGLALTTPRLALFLTLAVLAVVATPLFPGFFAMLEAIVAAGPSVAVGLVAVWLLWSWTAARLLQGLLVGPSHDRPVPDLGVSASWAHGIALALLVLDGLYLAGGL